MYFISDIKKMLSSRIVQITFIFLLVTMLADPISVLIHARRYTGFFENIGANPFQFWLLMNSASWGNKVYNILFWVIPVLAILLKNVPTAQAASSSVRFICRKRAGDIVITLYPISSSFVARS